MNSNLVSSLFAVAFFSLCACGASTVPADVASKESQLGQIPPVCTQYEPGCGANPLPEGCYVACQSNAECKGGERCDTRSINPCPADPNGGATCDACGMEVSVCVAVDPPSCTQYEPGCGSNPIPAAGCYVSCASDADCTGAEKCQERTINPCPVQPGGGTNCNACGMTVSLCL